MLNVEYSNRTDFSLRLPPPATEREREKQVSKTVREREGKMLCRQLFVAAVWSDGFIALTANQEAEFIADSVRHLEAVVSVH